MKGFAELSTHRVLNLVKVHNDITAYLPDLEEGRNSFIERDYLFNIINSRDENYFREALAELEIRRGQQYQQQTDESGVEID